MNKVFGWRSNLPSVDTLSNWHTTWYFVFIPLLLDALNRN
ncbi:hypothetical protein HMPREF0277_1705 [Corynebacterium accolens ATCC 49726]|nr:hypothetical protein HMPREF0277_1705 [Corynebacterium accolens ATCC 49726]